ECLQAGIERIGAPAPEGTAEALTVLCETLDAAGLKTYKVGLGDASLYPALLNSLRVDRDRRDAILTALARGDFVGVEFELEDLALSDEHRQLLLRVPRTRGGPEVFESLDGALAQAGTGMQAVHELLTPRVAE